MSLVDIFYKKEQVNIRGDDLTSSIVKQNKKPFYFVILGSLPIFVAIIGLIIILISEIFMPNRNSGGSDGFLWTLFSVASLPIGLIFAITSLLTRKKDKPIKFSANSKVFAILETFLYSGLLLLILFFVT